MNFKLLKEGKALKIKENINFQMLLFWRLTSFSLMLGFNEN